MDFMYIGEKVCKVNGVIEDAMRFVSDFDINRPELWKRFVRQFRGTPDDHDYGWRCEYWGKMMRGSCFVYQYTKDETLHQILTDTVKDMLTCIDADGRISTYSVEKEFTGWDLWGRKYVLLGMQYYLEICRDKGLAKEITANMCKQMDYIISKIGKEEGKKDITAATNHWRGLNSCSILEPVVKLYNITGEKRYLDFAGYIVGTGATSVVNIFELAYENKFYPYQYPVTKAYEMISCFEGLLEYYKITGVDWHRQAIINFADRILESDFTIIGCSGCTHELFDHSTVRQANTTNGERAQETCVTVTLMKFFCNLLLLTGTSKYADAFECALYNAYMGAFNTERALNPHVRDADPEAVLEPLPFDSYSPLTAGVRGVGIGGLKIMEDHHYYGCCACIGALGIGLVPQLACTCDEQGIFVNLYVDGRVEIAMPDGEKVKLKIETAYPADGHVKITFCGAQRELKLRLRNPEWSETTEIFVNGTAVDVVKGYVEIEKCWSDDVIEIKLDMRTRALYPIPYGHEILMNKVIWGQNYMIPTYDEEDPLAKDHIAIKRGPLILAADNRLGRSVDEPIPVAVNAGGIIDATVPEQKKAPYANMLELNVPLADGSYCTMTDYASAGKTWTDESKMAAWIRVR